MAAWAKELLQQLEGVDLKVIGETLLSQSNERKAAVAAALAGSVGAAYFFWQRNQSLAWARPYQLRDFGAGEVSEDPKEEFQEIVTWVQDALVRPINARLPGNLFGDDLYTFPFTPMVLMLGNHSSGKSTFINELLGVATQETGMAPTDDSFTVLERHPTKDETEDGPTLLGCPENRCFKELQRFGQAFWGHFLRKRRLLPESSCMPFGLQIVDTPGMIDMPGRDVDARQGRGYNFLEAVRWFAKRSDLVLLLFDPDKPGTTGETLDVLMKSLAGLDHKLLIILNKADLFDNGIDFARAYGTLGWALAKVIPRKDLPMIYAMYNNRIPTNSKHQRECGLPLEDFDKKREEVLAEVLRAKARHWDNVVTSLETTLRQVQMVGTICNSVRSRVLSRRRRLACGGILAFSAPLVVAGATSGAWSQALQKIHDAAPGRTKIWAAAAAGSYLLASLGATWLLRAYVAEFQRLQMQILDEHFEESYAHFFIHTESEDLRARWQSMRAKVVNIVRACDSAVHLPAVAPWELSRIEECLEADMWQLRQLAKQIRGTDSNGNA